MSKKKRIKEATVHILNGLSTDGAHHKQHDLEEALIALRGEEWVAKKKAELVSDEHYVWEKGIPA